MKGSVRRIPNSVLDPKGRFPTCAHCGYLMDRDKATGLPVKHSTCPTDESKA